MEILIGGGIIGYIIGLWTGWGIGKDRCKKECMKETEHLIDMFEAKIENLENTNKEMIKIIENENNLSKRE